MGDPLPFPAPDPADSPAPVHRRRPRYAGRYPRRFEEKYKELAPNEHPETIAKVLASGKTPAGTHRPILIPEILTVLDPRPGEVAVDATLGYGGHAQELLARLRPGGRLIGLDADPVELPKTEARLRAAGWGPEEFQAIRTNFAGLPAALASVGISGADLLLADLGVSSMQLDDPARGFSWKTASPLDMRMNPARGRPASAWIAGTRPAELARWFKEHADEPHADDLAVALAGGQFATTKDLAIAVRKALGKRPREEQELAVRRVFQAIRIEVNDEFSALESLLRHLPACLGPGGRVAILSFHSGEDRRVKQAFAAGRTAGLYSAIAEDVIRPGPEERRTNPRSTSAKLRWARRAG